MTGPAVKVRQFSPMNLAVHASFYVTCLRDSTAGDVEASPRVCGEGCVVFAALHEKIVTKARVPHVLQSIALQAASTGQPDTQCPQL